MQLSSQTIAGSRWTIRIRRTLYVIFASIFIFECLNYMKVLSFHVDYTWFGRLVSTLTVFGLLRLIDLFFRRKTGAPLSGKIWLLLAGLLAIDFVGDVLGFYRRWEWYDQLVHFVSGPVLVASLILACERLADYFHWNAPRALTYSLALGITTIFAVLYEIEEYSEDFFYQTNRLGDGPDTVNDLLMNLIGASVLILGLVVYRVLRKRQGLKQLT